MTLRLSTEASALLKQIVTKELMLGIIEHDGLVKLVVSDKEFFPDHPAWILRHEIRDVKWEFAVWAERREVIALEKTSPGNKTSDHTLAPSLVNALLKILPMGPDYTIYD